MTSFRQFYDTRDVIFTSQTHVFEMDKDDDERTDISGDLKGIENIKRKENNDF